MVKQGLSSQNLEFGRVLEVVKCTFYPSKADSFSLYSESTTELKESILIFPNFPSHFAPTRILEEGKLRHLEGWIIRVLITTYVYT